MKFNSPLLWVLVILGVAIGIGVLVFFTSPQNPSYTNPSSQIACTEEAMMCPDGSYVGRTGPRCEFTACPKE